MDRVVAVGLGSNLGDRQAHLLRARSRLQLLLGGLRFSSVRQTAPLGVPDRQPLYLNAVAIGTSDASPRQLLQALQTIEEERGRQRPYRNAPRTLDLDLLFVGDIVITDPDLVLPHPRMFERAFVLEPLAELVPEWRHPVSGCTAEELLGALRRPPPVFPETPR